jgi:hypothetical protein
MPTDLFHEANWKESGSTFYNLFNLFVQGSDALPTLVQRWSNVGDWPSQESRQYLALLFVPTYNIIHRGVIEPITNTDAVP